MGTDRETINSLASPVALLGGNNQIAALEELRDYLLPLLKSGDALVGDVTQQNAV